MTPYRLNIVFSGIDLNDDAVFGALAGLPNVTWRSQGQLTFATAVVDAPTALKAADEVVREISSLVASARPLRLDEDLVSIPDVAERVGVTREAVRNWANGTRKANFPLPRGIVGGAIKIWAWSEVNEWLRRNLNVGDTERFTSPQDAVLINALFEVARDRQATSAVATSSWTEASELVRSTTETQAPERRPRRVPWTKGGRRPHALALVPRLRSVAA
jgi:predicted DNA-binding transcriptional regulator AlpA